MYYYFKFSVYYLIWFSKNDISEIMKQRHKPNINSQGIGFKYSMIRIINKKFIRRESASFQQLLFFKAISIFIYLLLILPHVNMFRSSRFCSRGAHLICKMNLQTGIVGLPNGIS